MAPPPVTIYVTSLTSQPRVRQHIDLLHRSLKGLEIPYEAFDLVMDEQAKTRWQRAKPPGKVVGLPGYLVGGEWVGTMEDFEEAVETATLPQFLKQDVDLDTSNGNASGNIAEAELEKLMREMTEGDLDKLAGEIGVDGNVGKVGLITSPSNQASTLSPTSTSTTPAASVAQTLLPSSSTLTSTSTSSPPLKGVSSPVSASATKTDRRVSIEDKAEVAREMMEAGTVDGLIAAVEKAEGKEKVD